MSKKVEKMSKVIQEVKEANLGDYATLTEKDGVITVSLKGAVKGQKRAVAKFMLDEDDATGNLNFRVLRNKKVDLKEIDHGDSKKYKDLVSEVFDSLVEKIAGGIQKSLKKEVDTFEKIIKENDLPFIHFTDLDANIYHSASGYSRSSLNVLYSDSYLEYEYRKNNPKGSSKAMDNGTAFHSLVLDPKNYKKEVAVTRETGTKKKELEKVYAVNKAMITESEEEVLLEAKKSVMKHPIASKLIKAAQSEVSIFWKEGEGPEELLYKCRPDGLIKIKNDDDKILELLRNYFPGSNLKKGDTVLFDLKFTSDLSKKSLEQNTYKFGYDMQAHHYSRGVEKGMGLEVKAFIFINVQSKAPYDVRVTYADESVQTCGDFKRQVAVKKLLDVLKNPKAYKGVSNSIEASQVPHWAINEINEKLHAEGIDPVGGLKLKTKNKNPEQESVETKEKLWS